MQIPTSANPLLSVIVPVYNSAAWLRPCLDSICNQTYSKLEILCVDDCSPDNSSDILAEYAARDPRVRIINREKNGGVAAARNSGLDAATGEFLTFVDPDDTVDLNAFEESIAHFDDDVDLICFHTKTSGPPSQRKEKLDQLIDSKHLTGKHGLSEEAIEQITWTLWSKIFRRSLIEEHHMRLLTGIWQDDLDFVFRYLSCCRALYGVAGPKYRWLVRADSTSAQAGDHMREELNSFIAHEHILQFLQDNGKLDRRSPLVRSLVRNILFHNDAFAPQNRKEAKRLTRLLFNKWALWSVDTELPGFNSYRGTHWRLHTPNWLLPFVKLFYIRKNEKISYKLFGLSIVRIHTRGKSRRYTILGIPIGRPTSAS